MNALRPMTLTLGLVGLWQLLVTLTEVPPYILPGPLPVARAMAAHLPALAGHLGATMAEISPVGVTSALGARCSCSAISSRHKLPKLPA